MRQSSYRFLRRCGVALTTLCLATLASLAAAAPDTTPLRPLSTDRGRVVVDRSLGYPRLLTDRGTPLRGAAISWDARRYAQTAADVPSQTQLDQFAHDFGMNAVHLYLEKYDTNPDGSLNAGVNEAACDLLVDRCSKAGLYVVITIGNGNQPNLNCYMPSIDFDRSFWKVYAPRYSRRTNVIYEIQNEPGPDVENIKAVMDADPAQAPPTIPSQHMCTDGSWTTAQYVNEIDLYRLIRARAPKSHVMMFSWCDFDNAGRALDAVRYATAHGVDWSKTSVSVHGYVEGGMLEPTVRDFLASRGEPAALTCTEVADGGRMEEVDAYESHHVGWLLFTWVNNYNNCLPALRKDVENSSILWKPDFGTWPGLTPRHVTHGPVKIDCAGSGAPGWLADVDGRHGSVAAPSTNPVDLSGVVDPAPETVYQTERYGQSMTYTMPGFKPYEACTVRLHMCENYWTSRGKRVFDVSINGAPVLNHFDLFAAAGAAHKAYVAQFRTRANSHGKVVVDFKAVVDNASIDGIEVLSAKQASAK